ELPPDLFNIRSNGCLFSEARRIANVRARQSQKNDDDADHDHDLKKRKSLLPASYCHSQREAPKFSLAQQFSSRNFLLAGFEQIIRLFQEICYVELRAAYC